MENQTKTKTNTNRIKIVLVAIGLVIVIAAAIFVSNKKSQTTIIPTITPSNQEEEITQVPDASTPIDTEELKPIEIPNVEGAKVVVEGANAITPDNKVVTETGKLTENVVLPMSENAPRQTGFLEKDNLSKGVVQIEVGDHKFSPNEFSTKAGFPTTFSLTSTDNYSHLISFDDPILNAIAILVGPGQTKAITFNAPATAGTYAFHCASPNHIDKGEKGKMIVK